MDEPSLGTLDGDGRGEAEVPTPDVHTTMAGAGGAITDFGIAAHWAQERQRHAQLAQLATLEPQQPLPHQVEGQMCIICFEDVASEAEGVGWPGCGHVMHTECISTYLRVACGGLDSSSMERISRTQCPYRGQVVAASCGLGIEACYQRFGSNPAARGTLDRLRAVSSNTRMEPLPDTVRQGVCNYGTLTCAAEEAPQPHQPSHVRPLCHHRVGGAPPHFQELPDRCMHWAPDAVHEGVQGGARRIVAWTETWVCHTCQRHLGLRDIPQPNRQGVCQQCGRFQTWIFDAPTQTAEWRCHACHPNVWVDPYGAGGRSGRSQCSRRIYSHVPGLVALDLVGQRI